MNSNDKQINSVENQYTSEDFDEDSIIKKIEEDKLMIWLNKNLNNLSINNISNQNYNCLNKIYSTGYCFDERMLLHKDFKNDHYEKPERAMSIYMELFNKKYLSLMKRINVTEINDKVLLNVHTQTYIDSIKSLEDEEYKTKSGYRLCHDTVDNYYTYLSAKLSTGGLINCINEVLKGNIDNAFAIIRPPGHHAENNKCSGFCFFNNVAVAAKYIIGKEIKKKNSNGYSSKTIKKVAILDWDVHHGNGTQNIFYEENNVLFISLHRFDKGLFYPFVKNASFKDVGLNKGEGFNINIPWNTYAKIVNSKDFIPLQDEEYIAAFELIVKPILIEFNADIILISSGFDAAENDYLGQMKLTPFVYYYMTKEIVSKINSNVIIALEGGYNINSISRCSEGVVRGLMNIDLFNTTLIDNENLNIIDTDYKNLISKFKNNIILYFKEYFNVNKIYLNDILKGRNILSKYWKSLTNTNIDYYNNNDKETTINLYNIFFNKIYETKKNSLKNENYLIIRLAENLYNNKENNYHKLLRFCKKTTLYYLGYRIIESSLEGHELINEENSCNLTINDSINIINKFLMNNKLCKEELVMSIKSILSNIDINSCKDVNYCSNKIEQILNFDLKLKIQINTKLLNIKDSNQETLIKQRLRNKSKTNICRVEVLDNVKLEKHHIKAILSFCNYVENNVI